MSDSIAARTQQRSDGDVSVQPDAPRYGRVAVLAAGDLVVLLLFVVVGLNNHKEAVTAGSVVRTAVPFVLAWFVVAPWLGAFGRAGSAATTQPGRLVGRAAMSWVVAWALALVLRGVVFHDSDAVPFAIIALVFNAVLLLGWRGALSWLFWHRRH